MTADDLTPAADSITPFVREKVAQDNWGFLDALGWGKEREAVDAMRAVVMLVRLCGDEQSRREPIHHLIHQAAGLKGCAGPTLVVATAEALGLSDARAAAIVARLDQEIAAMDGMVGSG